MSLIILMFTWLGVLRLVAQPMAILYSSEEILCLGVLKFNLPSPILLVSPSIEPWQASFLRLFGLLICYVSLTTCLIQFQPSNAITKVLYFSVEIPYLTNEQNMLILIIILFVNWFPPKNYTPSSFPTHLQLADIFTKSLKCPLFERFLTKLRVGPPPLSLPGGISENIRNNLRDNDKTR